MLGGSPAASPPDTLILFFKKGTRRDLKAASAGRASSCLSCAGWQPLARPRVLPVPGCGADTVKAPAGSEPGCTPRCTPPAEPNLPSQDVRAAGTALQHPWCCRIPGAGGSASPPPPDTFSQGHRDGVGTARAVFASSCCSCSAPAVAPLPKTCRASSSAGSSGFFYFFLVLLPDRASLLEHRSEVGGVLGNRCCRWVCGAAAVAWPWREVCLPAPWGAAHRGPAGTRWPDGPRCFCAGVGESEAGISTSDASRLGLCH